MKRPSGPSWGVYVTSHWPWPRQCCFGRWDVNRCALHLTSTQVLRRLAPFKKTAHSLARTASTAWILEFMENIRKNQAEPGQGSGFGGGPKCMPVDPSPRPVWCGELASRPLTATGYGAASVCGHIWVCGAGTCWLSESKCATGMRAWTWGPGWAGTWIS